MPRVWLLLAFLVPVAAAEPDVLWTSEDVVDWASDGWIHDGRVVFVAREGGMRVLLAVDVWDGAMTHLATGEGLASVRSDGTHTVFTQRIDSTETIMWLDEDDPRPLAPSGARQQAPALHNGHVAWVDSASGAPNVVLAPIGPDPEVVHVSPSPHDQVGPTLHDGHVAWTDHRSATPLYGLLPARSHPNNIDIYAYDRSSNSVLPVAEENDWQDRPVLVDDGIVVYRSVEPAGRQLFVRELDQRIGQREAIDPAATGITFLAAMGDRLVYIDSRADPPSLIVWSLHSNQRVGTTGPLEAVMNLNAHAGLALVERITSDGVQVLEAIRLPTDLRPVITAVHHANGQTCATVRVENGGTLVQVWTHAPNGTRTVHAADGQDPIEVCAPPGSTLRAADEHGISERVAFEARPMQPTPTPVVAVLVALALVGIRR